MGLLKAFKQATDTTRGQWLKQNYQETIRVIESDVRIKTIVLSQLEDAIADLSNRLFNMTPQACVKEGKRRQALARKSYDSDIANSCSDWLTGAWLEAIGRESVEAREVRQKIEALIQL